MEFYVQCPKCGEKFKLPTISDKKTTSDNYYESLSNFSERLINILRNLYLETSRELPSTEFSFKQFLDEIQNCNERVIETQIDKYLRNEMHRHGYGLNYLRKMIINFQIDFPKILENEKKAYGTIPELRKPKNKESKK